MLLEIIERLEARWNVGQAQFLAGRHMENLPPKAPVPQKRVNVLMTGKTPIALLLPFECWHFLAQLMVGGVGILVELRRARV